MWKTIEGINWTRLRHEAHLGGSYNSTRELEQDGGNGSNGRRKEKEGNLSRCKDILRS